MTWFELKIAIERMNSTQQLMDVTIKDMMDGDLYPSLGLEFNNDGDPELDFGSPYLVLGDDYDIELN